MILKEKSFLWKFTWPFAYDNYTFFWGVLYHPKGQVPSDRVLRHELIHEEQANKVGWLKFYFLYLFALPFLWNPWRFKWEYEAYSKTSRMSDEQIKKLLRSQKYGWLRND